MWHKNLTKGNQNLPAVTHPALNCDISPHSNQLISL
jgi:hypothetical protein